MKYVKKNKNYQRINNKILKAYDDCLLKSGNENVNITDLCKIAKINRTTFYKHYKSIDDINDELEQDFIYHAFSTDNNANVIDFMRYPEKAFARLNKNILANKRLYTIILRPERLGFFNEKIGKALINDISKYRSEFTKIYLSEEDFKICVFSIVCSISNMYSMWLRGVIKCDITQLSNRICETIKSVFKHAERYKKFQ